MLKSLYKNPELLRFSIFIVWLINVSGFFGMFSDQKELFLTFTPYAILMSFILIFINSKINQKGFIKSILTIAIFGFIIEYLGANYGILFGAYSYGENLGLKVGNVPLIMAINWILLIIITGNFSEKVFKNSLAYRVIFGSLLMVILDFFIEFSAPKLDYWEFGKHPVPLSNYIWWFLFSIIFHIIYQININKEIFKKGEIPEFSFKPKSHYELGENLKMLDFDLATKTTGSRFVFVKSKLALLERALSNFMLDTHVNQNHYQEISPPLIASDNTMFGTGQLPKFENDQFEIKFDEGSDRKFLIPTAEVILTNIVKDKIVDRKDLPMRFVASTPCFRKEAGSYGKDTKGMIRQHQFYKVEMVSIVEKENCLDELERMTNCATDILDKLELPYRKIILCSGDMGFSAEKTYDIEVWLPSENKYREISSCSSCATFQGQRMKTRYKNENKETNFVGTLNGSGLAVGRTMIAVLENYQQKDGSIIIPKVLRPYMNNLECISIN